MKSTDAIAWDTGHHISHKVIGAVKKGIRCPVHTGGANNSFSLNPRPSIGYGILRGNSNIYRICDTNNIDYWNIDRGYMKPHHFSGYYRIAKNGLQPSYMSLDLPSDRFNDLKIEIEDWQMNDDGFILVCPPSRYMEIYYDMEPGSWETRAIESIDDLGLERVVKVRRKGDDLTPLTEDINRSYCVVTFNSNVAIDALLAGVPAITSDVSPVYGWNGLDISHIEYGLKLLTHTDRRRLFNFLSYCQYTLEEFESGSPWKIMKDVEII